MIKKYILPLLVLLTSIQSCESMINLGDDDLGNVLIMNAQMCSSDTDHIVWLSLSNGETISPVEKAVVSCYVNGRLVCVSDTAADFREIPFFAAGDASFGVSGYPIQARFAAGDQIRIVAESGEQHCEAQTVVPLAPLILSAAATPCTSSADLSQGNYRFMVTVRDLKDEYNYFYLRLLNQSSIIVEKSNRSNIHPGDVLFGMNEIVPINTTGEPLLNSGDRTLGSLGDSSSSFFNNKENLFTDVLFRNGDYSLHFYTKERFMLKPREMVTGDVFVAYNKAIIRLFAITREEYLYLTGYQFIHSLESGTYLTDEYIFSSNVNGGLGFVAVNSAADYEIDLSSYRYDADSY